MLCLDFHKGYLFPDNSSISTAEKTSIIAAFPIDAIISTRAAETLNFPRLSLHVCIRLGLGLDPTRAESLPHLCSYYAVTHLMGVMRVDDPGQSEVSDLEQELVCVDEYVGRLQISVQDISGVDEL